MILNFLMEDLENKKLDKEYKNNYSDLTEDEFLTLVKMDPNSYPRVGGGFDLNAEPITVGNLASGGKGGLLIRCFREGEKDILNKFKEVQDACLKFTQNRGRYEIKNAGQFPSVASFIKYVNSDGKEVDFEVNQVQQKKETTPEEKLEVLRQKQFPNIPNVKELIMVADLDEESDVEHGQVGQIAKTLLLPHYNAGERDFLDKKISLRFAIRTYYNSSSEKIKEHPIASYNVKEGNTFTKTILDFIQDWCGSVIKNSNLKELLDKYADPSTYEWWASTAQYDVIKYDSKEVGWILDICDITVNELESAKKRGYDNALESWVMENGTQSSYSKTTNCWCTGWPDSYINSYNNKAGCTLVAMIKRNRLPFREENSKNWQVSIRNRNAEFVDIEDGGNNHNGPRANWKNFELMLTQNKDVLAVLLSKSPFNENNDLIELGRKLKVSGNQATLILGSGVEVEPEPFRYKSPSDLTDYVEKTGDERFLNIFELIIEEGVTSIPNFQFQNWVNLIKVHFPESLKHIGIKSFAGCTSIVKLNLPPNLETIGMGAFEGCTSLRGSIRLPLSLRTIQWNAFSYHNSKGISFTISPKRLDQNLYPYPLTVAEEDKEFWATPGRIKFSDN